MKGEKAKQEILNKIPLFLAKTYRIVDNPQYHQVIGWSQDGESFLIKDVGRLTAEIFPKHFKHSNYLSFVRQLNFYGFRKKHDPEHDIIFHHPCFQQNHAQLLVDMKRRIATTQQPVGTVVAVSERQQRLQRELQSLKSQHQELQSMMEVLVNQNKSITAQNKMFAAMMGDMKDKYRKKLQTLMLLFLFGKKPTQNSDYIFPNQFQQMVDAFQQLKHGNPLLMIPNQRKRKQPLKMITGASPRFYQDIDDSEAAQPQQLQAQESFNNTSLGMKRMPSEQSSFHPFEDHNNLSPLPLSPFSVKSRGNMVKMNDQSWENYMNRVNSSDYSEFQLQKHEE